MAIVAALFFGSGVVIRFGPGLLERLRAGRTAPVKTEAPAATPARQRAPASRRIRLRSDPSGAAVFLAGRRIGTTPAVLSIPPGERARVFALHPGRRPGVAAIGPDGSDPVEIRLPPASAWTPEAEWSGPRGGCPSSWS